MTEQGAQFSCPNCGEPFYNENGYNPHQHSDHAGFHLDSNDLDRIKQLGVHLATVRELGDVEKARDVNLSSYNDLKDHLSSEHGHGIGPNADWESAYEYDLPKESYGDDDRELSLYELQLKHQKLHDAYPDEKYENTTESWHQGIHKHI